MGDYKDDFYNKLKTEFLKEGKHSFIYSYIQSEKEKNIRFQLKKRMASLQDERTSKEEYMAFLVEALLEDGKLRKLYSELEYTVRLATLGQNLKEEKWTQILEEVREEKKTVSQKNALNKQIKVWLKTLQNELSTKEGRKELPEVRVSLLEQVSRELLKVYEKGDKTTEAGERKDTYIELMLSFMEYQSGNIKNSEYMILVLEMLRNNTKLRLSETFTEWMLKFGKDVGGDSVYEGLRNQNAKYEKICEILKSEKAHDVDMDKDIGTKMVEMTNELQERLIQNDIATFFYDAGYSLNKEESHGDNNFRKKDKMMDLLDAYCSKNKIGFGVGHNIREKMSKEKYEECDTLCRILNQSKRENVMIPVMLDEETGAGIYIVGRNYFESSPKQMSEDDNRKHCCYAILEPVEWGEKPIEFWIDDSGYKDLPDMSEAVSWLNMQLNDGIYLEPYTSCNGDVPKDCPEAFKRYFSGGNEDFDVDRAITSEEKEILKNEFYQAQKMDEKKMVEKKVAEKKMVEERNKRMQKR